MPGSTTSLWRRSWRKLLHTAAQVRSAMEETARPYSDEAQASRLQKFFHFCALVGKSFSRNRGFVRAAALAYTTVLAIVPLMAAAISVSSAFLSQEKSREPMYDLLTSLVEKAAPALGIDPAADGEEAALARLNVIDEIQKSIENINSGTLGVSAVLALLFLAISLLATIEDSFNDMWGVTQGRSWFLRIVLYWAAVSLGPMFLLTAAGLTGARQFQAAHDVIEKLPFLGTVLFVVLPYVILMIACALLYIMIPNTKVQWRAAFVGGVVAGLALQLNSKLGMLYVSRVVTYNTIYGSLGTLPIFLMSLYFSWVIVLFGSQVAYAVQNRRAYMQERQAERINQRGREFVALRTMVLIAQRFQQGAPPLSQQEIAEQLQVPLRLVSQVMAQLLHAHIVVETNGDNIGCTPARPLSQISEADVLAAMREASGTEVETCHDAIRDLMRQEYEAIEEAGQLAGIVTFDKLIARLEAGEAGAPPATVSRKREHPRRS